MLWGYKLLCRELSSILIKAILHFKLRALFINELLKTTWRYFQSKNNPEQVNVSCKPLARWSPAARKTFNTFSTLVIKTAVIFPYNSDSEHPNLIPLSMGHGEARKRHQNNE